MSKFYNTFCKDIHFSDTSAEAFLKMFSCVFSFMGLLIIVIKKQDCNVSYFIFSVGIMADLCLRLLKRDNVIAKFIHIVIVLAFFFVLICAFLGMVGILLPTVIYKTLFCICVVYLILLVLDLIWINVFERKNQNAGVNVFVPDVSNYKEQRLEAFEEKLKI